MPRPATSQPMSVRASREVDLVRGMVMDGHTPTLYVTAVRVYDSGQVVFVCVRKATNKTEYIRPEDLVREGGE